MHFVCSSDPVIFQALLTEWVFLDVPVSDALPHSAVLLSHQWLTFLVVLFVNFLLMLLTVSAIGKFRATIDTTRSFRF